MKNAMKNVKIKHIKKLVVLFVLAVFLVSLAPLSLADKPDNGGNKNNGGKADELIADAATANEAATAAMQTSAAQIEKIEINATKKAKKTAAAVAEHINAAKKMLPAYDADKWEKFKQKHTWVADAIDALGSLGEDEKSMLPYLTRARLDACKKSPDKCKEILSKIKLKLVKKTEIAKKRALSSEMLRNARQNYLKAKEKFLEESSNYRTYRNLFLESKNNVMACKNKESEECMKLDKQALAHAKEMIGHGISMVVEHLNKLINRIKENENLDENSANEMIDDIEAGLTLLKEIEARLQVAKTKEEIKDIALEVHNVWKRYNVNANSHAMKLANSRVAGIIVKSNHLEKKLDSMLEKLKEKGYDTAEADGLIQIFSEKIEQARTKYTEAKGLLDEAAALRKGITIENPKENIEQIKSLNNKARGLIKEAHSLLTEAHHTLMDIVHKIIEQAGRLPEIEEVEEVVVEDINGWNSKEEDEAGEDKEVEAIEKEDEAEDDGAEEENDAAKEDEAEEGNQAEGDDVAEEENDAAKKNETEEGNQAEGDE